jgi:hypothetical protein
MNAKLNRSKSLLSGIYLNVSVLLFLFCVPLQALAFNLFGSGTSGEADIIRLEVAEPYIEMHTGPGRGYPVFNVVEQDETIEILMRKAGWYKIQSSDDKTGWVKSSQLAHTLKLTGVPVDLPEVDRGDFLTSRWRIGFSAGQLEGASTVSLRAGYRPLNWAGVEVEGGKIFDESVTSDFYGINLLVEPISEWIVTPFVVVGAGKFSFNERQKVLVDDAGSPGYGSIGAGASYYVDRNIVLRGEYRTYSVSTDEDRTWLNAWTIGLSAFF